ncbi:MAG: ABC transporter ATP-binding protein [Deltaproteobacteria bacterium]|nr:MAG: ABC transporter ATP-binding protein [Deltaproteobacteria bacterium]
MADPVHPAPSAADGLWLRRLTVQAGARVLVSDVSLHLQPGRIVALVGASGSGKTLTARACIGLVEPRPGVVGGDLEVCADGRRFTPYRLQGRARRRSLRQLQGRVVGWLPQEARASLDPLRTVGRQVEAVLRLRVRDGIDLPPSRRGPLPWLRDAGLDTASTVAALYPHELSGGMAQRVSIALALARGSRFLLADEPTTGLDPTVQAGILRQLRELARAGHGLLFITHDLRVVPGLADDVLVMHQGRVVEQLPAADLHAARAPAARALVEATARIAGGRL